MPFCVIYSLIYFDFASMNMKEYVGLEVIGADGRVDFKAPGFKIYYRQQSLAFRFGVLSV